MPEADSKVTPGQEADPLAVYLAAARERWNTAGSGTWEDYATALELLSSALRSAADVPRLLGAVEIALKQHRRAGHPTRCWDLDLRCPAHSVPRLAAPLTMLRDCPDCAYRERFYCMTCREDEWPCQPYRDITAGLLRAKETAGD